MLAVGLCVFKGIHLIPLLKLLYTAKFDLTHNNETKITTLAADAGEVRRRDPFFQAPTIEKRMRVVKKALHYNIRDVLNFLTYLHQLKASGYPSSVSFCFA